MTIAGIQYGRWIRTSTLGGVVVLASLGSGSAMGQQVTTPMMPRVESGQPVEDAAERNALEIIEVTGRKVSYLLGGLMYGPSRSWTVARGRYRDTVSHEEFFLTIGHPELAERETSRKTIGSALFWSGIAMVVGGLVFLGTFGDASGGLGAPELFGAGAVGGGFVMWGLGMGMDPSFLTTEEARILAKRYNLQLR